MQKNVPKYTPDWVPTVAMWAETSQREVSYALCDDRRTLLWFAQPAGRRVPPGPRPRRSAPDAHDPPRPRPRPARGTTRSRRPCRRPAWCARRSTTSGSAGAVKTSGAKGVHVFVPITATCRSQDAAAATRAIAARAAILDPDVATTEFVKEERGGKVFVDSTRVGGGTVVAAYSPRVRPGVPVSFPVAGTTSTRHARRLHRPHGARAPRLGERDPWAEHMPEPQTIPVELVEEGHAIPVGRVAAMHEGKRRARRQTRRVVAVPPMTQRRDTTGAVVVR